MKIIFSPLSPIASVGGYCTIPGQCLCHSGFQGVNCEVGMQDKATLSYCECKTIVLVHFHVNYLVSDLPGRKHFDN